MRARTPAGLSSPNRSPHANVTLPSADHSVSNHPMPFHPGFCSYPYSRVNADRSVRLRQPLAGSSRHLAESSSSSYGLVHSRLMTTQLHSVTGPESCGLEGTSTLLTVCARERTSAEARASVFASQRKKFSWSAADRPKPSRFQSM
jgi:hypothetical protein